ncbi:MAG: TVP38/TMEM64 family protein [Steroidobacteraceae bacterium]
MKSRALIGTALVALLVAGACLLPIEHWLRLALRWTTAHRESAAAPFFLLYVCVVVCLIPEFVLTLAAGAIFGLLRGTVLVSLASITGATAAFFVGRTLARDWVCRRIETWPRFRAVDRALGSRGFWVVLLTRLSPAFPYNLLNYGYSITAVNARDYITGSWLGMLPGTVLYVYAGSAAASLSQVLAGRVRIGGPGHVLLWAGLAGTVAVTLLIAHIAHRALRRELANHA